MKLLTLNEHEGRMDKWTALAKRSYVSRKFIRHAVHMMSTGASRAPMGFSGDVDPWVNHIVLQEADNMGVPKWELFAAGRTLDNWEFSNGIL